MVNNVLHSHRGTCLTFGPYCIMSMLIKADEEEGGFVSTNTEVSGSHEVSSPLLIHVLCKVKPKPSTQSIISKQKSSLQQ